MSNVKYTPNHYRYRDECDSDVCPQWKYEIVIQNNTWIIHEHEKNSESLPMISKQTRDWPWLSMM